MAAFIQNVVCGAADVGVRATVRRESSAFYGTSLQLPELSRQRNRFRRGAEAAFIGSAAALSRPRRKPGPAFCYIRKRSVRICCFPL